VVLFVLKIVLVSISVGKKHIIFVTEGKDQLEVELVILKTLIQYTIIVL